MAAEGSVTSGGATYANPHLPGAFVGAVEEMYKGTRLGAQEIEGRLLSDVPGALWTMETIEACRVEASGSASQSSVRAERSRGTRAQDRTSLDYARDERKDEEHSEAQSKGGGADALRLRSARTEVGEPVSFLMQTWPAPPRGAFHGRRVRVVIGVDPPSGDGTCGIVVCALDRDGVGHVLADHSVSAASPERWARAVADAAALYHREGSDAPLIVAEVNQGGRMVESVLRAAGPGLRIKLVRAKEGKAARAEPVALLFEAGRVRVHGRMAALEAELCGLIAGGGYEGPGDSPDRADAMVWALGELMLRVKAEPRVRGF
jgi:phage terminase large subunit-like protein